MECAPECVRSVSAIQNKRKKRVVASSISVKEFFDLFIEEIGNNPELQKYYKFPKSPGWYGLRKSYFCKRLEYIYSKVGEMMQSKEDFRVWDCGCGFGTTSIFLALNGIRVHGTTIGELYMQGIEKRKEFWCKYGDIDSFTASYEYLPDSYQAASSYDAIIIQDTLHHLEPLQEILEILYKILKPDGKLIVLEANGKNIIHMARNYLRRGNRRIIERHDERLNKTILYGNENCRGTDVWRKEFMKKGFQIDTNVEYIKFLPPCVYTKENMDEIYNFEQQVAQKFSRMKEFFFFGLNFTVSKVILNEKIEGSKGWDLHES